MSDLLSAMKTFVRVAARGSVSRAALDLDLAQASATRHLQTLEARYGVPLVVRGSRPLRLTPAGARVLEYAQAVLRSEGELAESLRQGDKQLSGRVSVAVPGGFGHVVVAPVAFSFARQHPAVQVRLAFSERVVNLVEEGVDVAIRIGDPPESSSLVRRPLGELEEWLVASPQWTAQAGALALDSPCALDAQRRILLTGTRPPTVVRGEVRHTLASPAALEVDSSLAMRDAALAGLGYAALHRYLVEEAVRELRLVRLLEHWSLERWPLAAYFAGRHRSAKVGAFVDALAAAVSSLGGVTVVSNT